MGKVISISTGKEPADPVQQGETPADQVYRLLREPEASAAVLTILTTEGEVLWAASVGSQISELVMALERVQDHLHSFWEPTTARVLDCEDDVPMEDE